MNILKRSERLNKILRVINSIESEKLYLTGGTLRNIVWNYLHDYEENYEIEDCDIIFYNSFQLSKNYEDSIRTTLNTICSDFQWSVKNQARMHIRNGHLPYLNINEALKAFPETCSSFALSTNWEIIAPYGLTDLLNFKIKPTPFCKKNEYDIFFKRVSQKKWLQKWPNLILTEQIRLTTMYKNNSQNISEIGCFSSLQLHRMLKVNNPEVGYYSYT